MYCFNDEKNVPAVVIYKNKSNGICVTFIVAKNEKKK